MRTATLMAPPLLGADDPAPVVRIDGVAGARIALVCDHAGRAVPRRLGTLGLSRDVIDGHIGWDPGAADVTRRLAARLRCPARLQPFSRLVVDCNRPPEAPDAMPSVSDGIPVPGNRNLAAPARAARVAAIFRPYQAAVADMLDGPCTLALAIHSFTPVLAGTARPWHVGVCAGRDRRAADALLRALARHRPDLCTGFNVPYAIDAAADWFVPVQCEPRELAHALIEIRNDLIATPEAAQGWADLLADCTRDTLAELAR